MAQEDFLKIILEAKLDDESLQNIKVKLEKLKSSVNEIKIKIVEDGSFSKIVENLTKNLEALNRNLSQLTDSQVKQLKQVGEQAKKNAEQIKQGKKQEQAENNKIREQEDKILKTRTRFNDVGQPVQQARTYAEGGDKNRKRTVTTDLETGEQIGNVLNEENEKIRKEQEKRKELIQQYQKLRKQYMAELTKMEKAGASKGATEPLRANLTENFRQKEIFGTDKNPQDDFEKRYKEALAETNAVMKKSIEYQKNLNKIREAQKDMVERRDALKEQGYDVESINKLMQSQLQANKSSQELSEGIKKINKELSDMEKSNKTFTRLEEQARKLGITIDKSFKSMGRDTDLTEFSTKIANIQALINAKKEQANETTRVEIQQMERLLSQLTQEFQQRQRIAQEELQAQQHRNRIAGDRIDDDRYGEERVNQVFTNPSVLGRQEEARDLARQWIEANTEARNLDTSTARLIRTVDSLGNEQMRVTYVFQDSTGAMQSASVVLDQTTSSMYNLGQSTQHTQQQTHAINGVFERLGDSLRRVATYVSTFGVAYEIMNQVGQSFQVLYEVDEAMTNLAKVTTATTVEFEAFRLEASQIGQELGATTAEVTKAVTEFQKLGYTFEQSKGLGETALIYANVGDMNIEQANESMISALKGFGVANEEVVTESERYLDIFNEVGNQFAVSSAGIGEALKRSSASLYEAGNDVEHAVAMITAANAVIQDEKKVGTALKTVSMRLRGMDEETGKVTKSVPEVANQFRAAGVEIMESADTFKSTYEIMDQLAKNWKNLTDVQQAALVETIGGKHHGTVVSAMLNNWTDATNSLAVAQGSAGSSAEEFAKYQESLVYRVDRLKASYEEFWLTFWDDEAIKTAIDGLNSVLNGLTNLIQTFGSLSVAASAIVPILMLMAKPLRQFVVSAVDMQAWGTATAVATGNMTQLQRATTMATVAVKALGKAMIIGLAISAVIWGLTKAYDALTGSHKKYLESIQEEYQAQEQLIGQLEQVDLTRFAVLEDKKIGGTIDDTELQEYVRLQDQLKSSGQDVISHYDEQGNAVLLSADALIQLNKERREELTLIREKKVEEEKKAALGETGIRGKFFNNPIDKAILDVVGMDTDVGRFDEAVAKAEESRNKLNTIKKDIESMDIIKDVISSSDLASMKTNNQAFQAEITKISQQLQKLRNEGKISESAFQSAHAQIANYRPSNTGFADLNVNMDNISFDINEQSKEVQAALSQAESEIDSAYKALKATLEDDFQNFIDEEDIDLESDAGEVAKMLQEAYIDALKKGQFEDVEEAYRDYKDNLISAMQEIENAGIDMEDLAKGSPQAIEQLNALGLTMGQNSAIATLYGNSVALANQKILSSEGQVSAQTSNMTALRQELNSVMSAYDQRATYLAEVLKQVNHGEALSVEQVNQLLGLYPQLNSFVETHNGVLSIKASAIQDVMAWEEANTKSSLEQLKATATAQLEQVKLFIQGKSAQVKAVDALQQASIKADNATIASAAAAAGAAMRASIIKKNAALDPVAQLDAREIESRAYGAERATYNSMMGAAKAQAANLQGFIAMLDSLKGQNLTANKIKEVDPPKAGKAPKADKGAKETAEETENLIYIADEYKNVMRELNMQIAANRELMEEYPSYSKEYQEGLKREIGLIGKKIKATEEEYASLEKQIAQRKLEKTGLVDLNKAGGGGGGSTYTVARGDTLSAIAKKFNTNYQAIAKANNLANPNRISIGQRLTIGGAGGGGGGGGGITRNLRVGSRGEDVKALQRALGITADGIFGNQTANAVRNFQRSKGLGVDAIAGVKTLGALGLWGTGAKGDTPQNAQAKLEEELDKARDELEKLQQERIALRKEANELTLELIESEVARLDREAGLLADDLANVDYLSIKLDENSEAWRKNRGERLEFLNTQAAQHAESMEFLENEIATAENILNEKMSDAVYDLLNEQKVKYLEMQQQIYEESQAIAESVINEIVETYERDFGDLDRQLTKLTNIASRIGEGDLDKYAEAQEDILDVYQKQITLTNERLNQLKEEEETVKNYPELYNDWKEEVIELEEAQEELNQAIWESQKDMLDTQEGAIDEVIELFQEYYESRQEMELNAIDEIMEKEEELLEKRLEIYEKDFEAFEENINKQLEALDKAENERVFERDLGQRQQSAQEIMDMIGLVSLDTSAQGRQRLRQLQEELKTITDEISEMQLQRRLQNRQEALQKELEARAEETDKISEAEENRLDKEIERLEKHAEEVERKWENLINNERMFAKMREELLAGNIEEMSSQIDSFNQIIADSSKEMGEAISQNLIDNFINARKELLELDKVLTESQIDFNELFGSNANRVTSDMISDIPMANPLNTIALSNPNNLPVNQNPLTNNQVVNLTVNIDTIQGGQDGADTFINAVTNGLARKGVTI
jgi:TP901 family phage tail tape measure protein